MLVCAGYLRRACAPVLRRHRNQVARFPSQRYRVPGLVRACERQLSIDPRDMSPQPAAAAGSIPTAEAAKEAGPSFTLDREQFKEELNVKALRVPTKQCQQYMALLSRHLLNKPRLKNTQSIQGDSEHLLLLLSDQFTAEELPDLKVTRGGESIALGQLIEVDSLQVTDVNVAVDYSYWPASHILQRILPAGCEVPSSFEAVGHIAHLNLREELLPWKHVIGQVLLDKNPRLRTVVNKVGSIENEWRVFQMEVLATTEGKQAGQGGGTAAAAMETEVRQHGARFKLDFSKVYWNSRLETEHHRLVKEAFRPGEVVLDVMAGIGPFAVPAAQKGCTVWANDLNPDSYKWLRTNIALNKVSARVTPFNLDGREAIRLAARGALPLAAAAAEAAADAAAAGAGKEKKGKAAGGAAGAQGRQSPEAQQHKPGQQAGVTQGALQAAAAQQQPATGGVFDHAVMNLPASAVEFLDAYRGAFDPELWRGHPLPLVHVYTFCKDKEEDTDGMRRRVEAALGGPLDAPPTFHLVRDVAPNKKMYCITFRVPAGLAFEGAAAAAMAAAQGPAAEQQQHQQQQEAELAAGASGKRQKVG